MRQLTYYLFFALSILLVTSCEPEDCDKTGETALIVTFQSNGGTAVKSQKIVSGQRAYEPKNPTKSGSIFVNWYRDENLSTLYQFSQPVTADITLYAKWGDN